ncbi:uncharacterized protein Z520_10239 [Fonsecaea multimorphosa CBS 102226]|uniref:Oxidase ustYa n=1 Tax=Fonsecaea multimorphosa CBS 102226 TaxID=1442371 RepID=A0A0D2JKZ2_9EURO|nr:uncharacterized protein Z520_10239 [Fonsecaea multimorphosa CBS 102226]KIX93902.1 hypothetical protein Z520_10239 [Fonsecaea multimorphosa CBS 102226]OAL19256.1 hypothetical protein AYO22_09800 [Fonsecaea multimorphosa]
MWSFQQSFGLKKSSQAYVPVGGYDSELSKDVEIESPTSSTGFDTKAVLLLWPKTNNKSRRLLMGERRGANIFEVLIVLLLGLFIGISGTCLTLKVVSTGETQVPSLQPLQFPGVPDDVTTNTIEKVFNPDLLFDPFREDQPAEKAWYKYRSRFVFVENPRSYGLSPSAVDKGHPNRELYSVAGFHQLHCLGVIRYAWNTVLNEGNRTLDNRYPGMEDGPDEESYTIGKHFSHCIEIIRHALECYADPTLEPLFTDTGDHSAILASGWGTKHTCRNFETLTEWVDSNPASGRR